jgi:hypothetical protein
LTLLDATQKQILIRNLKSNTEPDLRYLTLLDATR